MALGLMERVVVVAARAFGNPAAVVTQQRRGKPAAVKEQNDLITGLQMLAHPGDKRRR